MPYFTVITPSFNQGPYIAACLDSVLAQDDPDFEHLVFDNVSSDDTSQVLAKYPHLKTSIKRDRGQSDAINQGFLAASGEIICWLNSDDAYPEGTFKRLREIFRDSSIDVAFGDVLQVGYDGSAPLRMPARFQRKEDLVRWWSSEARLHQPAIFFRRSVREKVGLLREDLHYAMDYEYWWRMAQLYSFHYYPEVLAIQHRQPDSKTIMDWSKVFVERERIFSPFYDTISGGNLDVLMQEKRQMMAKRYLAEAFQYAASSPLAARRAFFRALREDAAYALHFRSLGILTRMMRLRR